jgi:hypothetical protein
MPGWGKASRRLGGWAVVTVGQSDTQMGGFAAWPLTNPWEKEVELRNILFSVRRDATELPVVLPGGGGDGGGRC